MERKVYPGEFYRHFKNKLYQILTLATHSETGEAMVVYQALYGDYKVYVRPYAMFVEEVDHEKYPEVTQWYRFERVHMTASGQETTENLAGVDVNTHIVAGTHVEAGAKARADANPAASPATATAQATVAAPNAQTATPNPAFLRFLEAESYEERMEYLQALAGTATQAELDSIYVVLDMKPETGTVKEQMQAVGRYLTMQNHFEGSRLR